MPVLNTADNMYIGADPIDKVYLGTHLVWQRNAIMSLYDQILAYGPEGYWPMRETSGTTSVDATGNGHDGTWSGTKTLAAKVGFDGFSYPVFATSGLITVPAHANFDGTAGMTVLAMVWVDVTGTWAMGAKSNVGGTSRDWITSSNGTDVIVQTFDSGGSSASRQSVAAGAAAGLTRGAWNLIAFTISGTTGYPIIYTHGVARTASNTFTGTWGNKPSANIYIGQVPPALSQTDGSLAHYAVYTSVLTPAEIASIYFSAVYEGWIFMAQPSEDITFELLTVDDVATVDVIVPVGDDATETATWELVTVDDPTVVTEVLTPVGDDPIETTPWEIFTVDDVPATPFVRVPTSLSTAIIAKSPLGYWKLDETSGTNAADSSGNARNGTYSGAQLNIVMGLDAKKYAYFGGPGQAIVPDNNVFSLNNTPGLSFFWLSQTQFVGSQWVVICKMSGANQYEWFIDTRIDANGVGQPTASTSSLLAVQTRAEIQTTAGFEQNRWTAHCITMAGPGASDDMVFYQGNNTPQSTSVVTGAGVYANGTGPIVIGNRTDVASYQWRGCLGHMAIFAGVLNATQVNDLMVAAAADGWI